MANVIVILSWLCWAAAVSTAFKDEGNAIIWYTQNENAVQEAEGRRNSNIDERPYMLSMSMKEYDFSSPDSCDATVVSMQWALTSARCCVKRCGRPYMTDKMTLRGGSKETGSGGALYEVDTIVVKDGYIFNTVENNLCLIKMKTQFVFSQNLKAANLAGSETYSDGVISVVSGWSKKDGTSSQLASVTLPLISNVRCQELSTATISERLICAVTPGQDTCHGARGSPLMVDGQLVGVVSTGHGCGNNPGVFTLVSEYRVWFSEQMGDDMEVDAV